MAFYIELPLPTDPVDPDTGLLSRTPDKDAIDSLRIEIDYNDSVVENNSLLE